VWNRVVTERLKRFGTKVLVGDLAIRKDQVHLIEANVDEEVPDNNNQEDADDNAEQ
jgi:tRNA pseudouridine13 synthase